MGVLTRCRGVLHHRVWDRGPSAMVLPGPTGSRASAASFTTSLKQSSSRTATTASSSPPSSRSSASWRSCRTLILQMQGAGYVFSVVTEGPDAGLGGSSHRLRRRAALRVSKRCHGRRVDEHLSRCSHADPRVDPWACTCRTSSTAVWGRCSTSSRAWHPTCCGARDSMPSGNRWTWGAYSSSVAISVLGFCVWPHYFMKIYTAKRHSHAQADDRVLPNVSDLSRADHVHRLRRRHDLSGCDTRRYDPADDRDVDGPCPPSPWVFSARVRSRRRCRRATPSSTPPRPSW